VLSKRGLQHQSKGLQPIKKRSCGSMKSNSNRGSVSRGSVGRIPRMVLKQLPATGKCSICGKQTVRRGRGRPSKKSMNHSRTHVGCTSCGCGRNSSKTKVVAIYKRPNNGKIEVKIMNSGKGNMSRLSNKLSTSINTRPSFNVSQNTVKHHSKGLVRKMINKILSRKNHTKRHSLVSMMNSNSNSHPGMMNSNSNSGLMNSNSNSGLMNSQSSMMRSSSYLNSNMNKPIKKSKKVQSYYTSQSNGNHHSEKGRRIIDDSNVSHITINKLNNGDLVSYRVPRN